MLLRLTGLQYQAYESDIQDITGEHFSVVQ